MRQTLETRRMPEEMRRTIEGTRRVPEEMRQTIEKMRRVGALHECHAGRLTGAMPEENSARSERAE